MRKFLFISLLISMTLTYSSTTLGNSIVKSNDVKHLLESYDNDAIEYNDKIVGFQMVILEDMMSTMKLEGKNIIKDLKGTIKITKNSIKSLKKIKVYSGGEKLKDKALDLFNFYQRTMEGPWMEAFKIYDEKGSNMTSEELTRFQNLLTAPGVEEVKYDEAFAKAQNAYAKTNGFDIERNKMQDQFDN